MKLDQMFELLRLIDGVVNGELIIKDYVIADNTVTITTNKEEEEFFFYIERSGCK